MSVDFNRYQPPGVYTESVPGPQLAVQSATPTSVGIFGLSLGFKSDSEPIDIPTDQVQGSEGSPEPFTSKTLRQKGILKDTLVVSNPNTGQEFTLNTDYVVVDGDKGKSGTSRDDTFAIKRVDSGHIKEGDVVQVSYSYTDEGYFDPLTFFDYSDVLENYGRPFDSLGRVQSELSLAARFAFTNGAQRVVCVAVDPKDPKSPVLSEYEDALTKLEDHSDISVVVPATGMQQIHQSVISHVNRQSSRNYERRAIVGRDGSLEPIAPQQLITDAQTIKNKRVLLVAPAAVSYYAPELNKEVTLGGQYLAAALAGVSVSTSPAVPLTREQVLGFSNIPHAADEQKNLMSQAGVCVIERTREGTMRVRHGVTTRPDNLLTREWSITGQEDSLVFRLRAYLDSDGLIGSQITDLTLVNIKASADAALQSLTRDGVIRNYRELKVRQLSNSMDVVEVSFEWQASLPLNYIVVRYSISTTTGDVQSASPSIES